MAIGGGAVADLAVVKGVRRLVNRNRWTVDFFLVQRSNTIEKWRLCVCGC